MSSSADADEALLVLVLRGPFSALYGNAAGGVIQVFTESGVSPPTVTTTGANAKLDVKVSEATTFTVLGNHVNLPGAQDPLGLTRSEFDANARQVNPLAVQFNTRKNLEQTQGGARVRHAFNTTQTLELVVYTGERAVRQFQAIPVATQRPATYPGGVIDFDRN